MESLLEALHLYAQENRVMSCLGERREEYQRLNQLAGKDHAFLENALEGEAAAAFARYLSLSTDINMLEGMAMLRCGISIGLEIAKL